MLGGREPQSNIRGCVPWTGGGNPELVREPAFPREGRGIAGNAKASDRSHSQGVPQTFKRPVHDAPPQAEMLYPCVARKSSYLLLDHDGQRRGRDTAESLALWTLAQTDCEFGHSHSTQDLVGGFKMEDVQKLGLLLHSPHLTWLED